MKGMQADERVVSCPEQVCLDCQPVVIDEMAPLAKRGRQKDRSQQDGQEPRKTKRKHPPGPQQFHGNVDCQAAGEQTDRREDRKLENIVRLRSSKALADVENIGNNEDRENSGFGAY